jgi:hypothetical protein
MINIQGKVSFGPNMVKDGLILALDAANPKSYSGTGSQWNDLSGSGAHAIMSGTPSYVSNGLLSYWDFTDGNEFASVNISQEYRDIFIILDSNTLGNFETIFSVYTNEDNGLRMLSSSLRVEGSADGGDWHYLTETDVFINGQFDSTGVDLSTKWNFLRAYRANNSGAFGTSFRYEIGGGFSNRNLNAYIAAIWCYDRKLTNDEVIQNYNAQKNRFGT